MFKNSPIRSLHGKRQLLLLLLLLQKKRKLIVTSSCCFVFRYNFDIKEDIKKKLENANLLKKKIRSRTLLLYFVVVVLLFVTVAACFVVGLANSTNIYQMICLFVSGFIFLLILGITTW